MIDDDYEFPMACFCGCGRQRGLQWHHVIYQQELRRLVREQQEYAGPPDIVREMALVGDHRNMVAVGPKCHAAHHARARPYLLKKLPDSVFEFAEEVMGAGPAYEYLRRRYEGTDQRLDRLLETV